MRTIIATAPRLTETVVNMDNYAFVVALDRDEPTTAPENISAIFEGWKDLGFNKKEFIAAFNTLHIHNFSCIVADEDGITCDEGFDIDNIEAEELNDQFNDHNNYLNGDHDSPNEA